MNHNKTSLFIFLSRLFLSQRQLGVLVLLGMVFFGLVGFWGMPKQYNPEITAPAFLITTEYPGATTYEVREWLTGPLEDVLREIPDVDTVDSYSFGGGVSQVVVAFDIGKDEEEAKITLTQKLGSNMFLKPEGVRNPLIESLSPDDVPIVVLAFSSKEFSPEALRLFGFEVKNRIKTIPSVSEVRVYGGEERVFDVVVNVERLSSLGFDVYDVESALVRENIYSQPGVLEAKNEHRYAVRMWNSISSKEDIENVVLSFQDEQLIYLKDVAEVFEKRQVDESETKFLHKKEDGSEEVVFVAVSKQKGSNATKVSENIRNTLKEMEEERFIPEEITTNIVRDDGKTAKEEVFGLTGNLFLSIGIVSFIIFLFLGWRSAVVVLLSIPFALALVFGIGLLFEQTINRITLFALILSLGLLVDSAIVVVENMNRKVREMKEKTTKAIDTAIPKAVEEVGMGLFLSTLTTILAFVPMAYVTGMMGPYMGPIPFFVPVALLASLFIAYAINPMIFRIVISQGADEKDPPARKFLDSIKKVYEQVMRKILFKKKIRRFIAVGAFLLLMVSIMLPAFGLVPFRMLPKADKEQFFVFVDGKEKDDFSATQKDALSLAENIKEHPEVVSVQVFSGMAPIEDFNGLFQGSFLRNAQYQHTLRVRLTHPDTRKERSQDIVSQLRENAVFLPGRTIRFIEDPPGPPVKATYRLGIFSESEVLRDEMTRKLAFFARDLEGVVDESTTLSENEKTFSYSIDEEEAQKYKTSSQEIIQFVESVLHERIVGYVHIFEKNDTTSEPREIILGVRKESRESLSDLYNLSFANTYGQKVFLSDVLRSEEVYQPQAILARDYQIGEYVEAEMEGRSIIYAMIETLFYLVREVPKEDGGRFVLKDWNLFHISLVDSQTQEKLDVHFMGEWKLTLEVFRDLGIAFGVAIFAIFFVLAFQFRSLITPLLIMLTIPFSLIGVLPGFFLLDMVKGTFFNATSMIGVIALSGIVVNNAILFLEYLSLVEKDYTKYKEALIHAGKTRLAPILLTSLTTILGSLTIVSDPVWEGLAWSIVWGLSLSALLTLVLLPIFLLERKNLEQKRKFR
jgi:multidrug efflux pump subunit AcrB